MFIVTQMMLDDGTRAISAIILDTTTGVGTIRQSFTSSLSNFLMVDTEQKLGARFIYLDGDEELAEVILYGAMMTSVDSLPSLTVSFLTNIYDD